MTRSVPPLLMFFNGFYANMHCDADEGLQLKIIQKEYRSTLDQIKGQLENSEKTT